MSKNVENLLLPLQGFKMTYCTSFLFLFLGTLSTLFLPYLTGHLLDLLASAEEHLYLDSLTLIITAFVCLLLGHALSSFSTYKMAVTGEQISDQLRQKIVHKSIPDDTYNLSFESPAPLGDVSVRVSSDVDVIWDFYGYAIGEMFVAVATVVVMSVIIALISPILGIASFITTGLFGFFYAKHGLQMRSIFAKVGEYYESMIDFVGDYYPARNSIISYFCKGWVTDKFQERSQKVQKSMATAHRKVVGFSFFSGVGFIGMNFLLWMVALPSLFGYESFLPQLTVGNFVSILLYLGMLQQPLSTISNCSKVFNRAMVSLQRIFDFVRPTYADAKGSGAHKFRAVGDVKALLVSHVSVKPEADKVIVDDISFELSPGECLGITGVSGSGKSSLVKAIARIHPHNEGDISLGGQTIQHISEDSLREQIIYVEQDPFFLQIPVNENLTLGERRFSESDIDYAIHGVGLYERVQELPGMMTYDGPYVFSGGERQRLNLARAFVRMSASLYIFDEPTSALDDDNLARIAGCIKSLLSRGKMVIIVTHSDRLLSVVNKVLYMDGGKGYMYTSYNAYRQERDYEPCLA